MVRSDVVMMSVWMDESLKPRCAHSDFLTFEGSSE